MPQLQPIRTVEKGTGAWVNEIFINPVDNAVLKATAYTKPQLEKMKEDMKANFEKQAKKLVAILS